VKGGLLPTLEKGARGDLKNMEKIVCPLLSIEIFSEF
jgi:hypothetical protein